MFKLSKANFDFMFSDEMVDLLRILSRLEIDPYPTWQEASAAAIRFGIRDYREYRRRYKLDPRLPSTPYQAYANFPGLPIFLGQKYYSTWEAASTACIELRIKTCLAYKKRYKEDRRLPSHPEWMYPDFPNWKIFFGKKPVGTAVYATWRKASAAAKRLGIRTQREYREKYKQDPALPVDPSKYKGFPGLATFLGIT